MSVLTKNQLIIILVSYMNIQIVKTLNSNNSFINEYCDNQWPELLTCVSDRELDIKAIFDGLRDSQTTTPYYYEKLVWTAPLANGEIPNFIFHKYGAKIVEFSANNLEMIKTNAFDRTDMSKSILSWKFLPDQETKLKNSPDSGDLYYAFSQMSFLQELSINLDWDTKHDIPDNAFAFNNSNPLKNITFDGKFIISRIGSYLLYYCPPSFNKIIFKVTSIEMIADRAFIDTCTDCEPVYIGLQATQLNEKRLESGALRRYQTPIAYLHLGLN